ncbi:MAG TPA: redox-regulated ATPase YchF [Candidatus Gastranaerophilaceae bacterium]|nr:redox-regulated ATPase YchF [Candidatus Gastranaerophilaceae bacterium]
MLRAGIVGLPNVGKSTLFNALTSAQNAQSANYPFCTIEPNIGVVNVPDERLYVLKPLVKTEVVIPTAIEFVDIAGLVKGASKGEGLGNQFLHTIREVDAIIQVVRCFDDENTIHVAGKVNPVDDIEIINMELALADLSTVEKRQARISKVAKSGDKDALLEEKVLKKLLELLSEGKFINVKDHFEGDELFVIRGLHLMSTKPVIYCANVTEFDLKNGNLYTKQVEDYAKTHNAEVVIVSAKIESELSELDAEEAKEYLQELGIEDSGINRMIKAVYHLLDLRTFITAGEMEVRAWTIPAGAKAPQAAGVIHTDFEKGFIRAEVTAYKDFIACGSYAACKDKGLTRLEGKDYIVQDGDIVHFRFAV